MIIEAPLSLPESSTVSPSDEDLAESQVSASDSVFLGIMRGLESRMFAPGQRLVETDLVAQFGVGRNSVREALQRLAAEGIVEIQRHRGAVIRSFSIRETLDVLEVSELMCGLLAKTAAARAAGSGHEGVLRATLGELKDAAKAMDAVAFASARRRFYRALLVMAANRELQRLFPSIQVHIIYAQFRLPDLQNLRLKDYAAIAAAVLAGNAAAAEQAGIAHVRHVRSAILSANANAA